MSFFSTFEPLFKYGIVIFLNFSVLFYWGSFLEKSTTNIYVIAKVLTIIGQTFIFIELLMRWILFRYFPVSNLYETLLFLSWILLFILLMVESKVKSKIWGSSISPLSTLICNFAIFGLPNGMQNVTGLVPSLQSNWLMLHVSMMMLSYGTLLIGALLSILFLILSRNINIAVANEISSSANYSPVVEFSYKLESTNVNLQNSEVNQQETNKNSITKRSDLLRSIDIWSYRVIGLGFPMLTIGIIAGAVWANEAWGSYWSWDPKETWALITWLVFASYLHARITKGLQGKKAAALAAFGFFIIWVCYLGVNFLGKGLHSYGWIN